MNVRKDMDDNALIDEIAEAVIVPPDGGWGWVST